MNRTRRLTYSAVGVAISSVCVILTSFLPLSVSLLAVAAICYYIIFDKCGLTFGFLTVLATFAISCSMWLSGAFILNAVLFSPYAIIAFFARKFNYFKIVHAIIRAIVMVAYSTLMFFVIYHLAGFITNISLMDYINQIGYVVVSVIFTVIAVTFDLLFTILVAQVSKRLK